MIPKSDRRARNRQRKRIGWPHAALATIALTIATGTAFALARPEAIDALHVEETLAAWKTKTLIAAGFGISQVSVTGQRYTPDADVIDALDLPNVKTFADLDGAAALKRIERLPWVDTAQITRAYPSAMTIQIRERIPYALWQRGDRTMLIDVTGRVLGPVAANQNWNLPVVSGEGANGEAALLLTAMSRHPEIGKHFSRAERITARRWSVVMQNGTRIELGAERHDEGLAQVAGNSELRRALSGPPVVIDVRTPGRLAVRPAAATPSAALATPTPASRLAAVDAEAPTSP